MARSAAVSTASVDALLEAWHKTTVTLELVRDVCFEHLEREPGSELAAWVLMATVLPDDSRPVTE